MKEFLHTVRVYIEDTDAGGIVYYVNYLKFFERTRTEFLRSLGYGKVAVLKNGLLLVVRRAQVEYRAPAELDDELLVTAQIIKLGRSYVTFVQEIRRGEEVLCSGEIQVACVKPLSGAMKPTALPVNIYSELKNWMKAFE